MWYMWQIWGMVKPACLIIRLLFGFVSNSIFAELNQKLSTNSETGNDFRLGSTVVDLSQQGSYRFIREGCARWKSQTNISHEKFNIIDNKLFLENFNKYDVKRLTKIQQVQQIWYISLKTVIWVLEKNFLYKTKKVILT